MTGTPPERLPVVAWSWDSNLAQIRADIEAATSITEVKDVHDKAEAVRIYIQQAGLGLEMQNRCAELKLRAERRGGEILSDVLREPSQGRRRGSAASLDHGLRG